MRLFHSGSQKLWNCICKKRILTHWYDIQVSACIYIILIANREKYAKQDGYFLLCLFQINYCSLKYNYCKPNYIILGSQDFPTKNAKYWISFHTYIWKLYDKKMAWMFILFPSLFDSYCKYHFPELSLVVIDQRLLLTMKNLVTYSYHILFNCHHVSYGSVIWYIYKVERKLSPLIGFLIQFR